MSKKLAFLVLRENVETVQCLVQTQPDSVSEQMVKFTKALSRESVVDVHGVVSIPAAPIKGTTQQVFISFLGFLILWCCENLILECELYCLGL